VPKYKYNPIVAKKMLEKAGFTYNSKTQLMEKYGKPFEFTVITNKGNKEREKAAQIIQQYLAQVGIKMNIQLLEWSAFIKILNSPQMPKNFDAVLLGWSLSIDPDMYELWHSSEYPKGFNLGGYKDKRVDELLEKGRTEINREKRKGIYKELYLKIANDQPYYFLYYPESVVGINKRVKGLSKPGPAGVMPNIEKVWVESN
jgi:peptide/nickel transport system substrate-binding protein